MNRRSFLAATTALFALPKSGHAQGVNRREFFEVCRPELFVPGLHPAHDGLVVAQLSDVHVGRNTPDGRVLAAVRAVNDAQPDLVLLTGDYVTHKRDPLERVPLVLKGLRAPTVAVLGNHDHWSGADALTRGLEGVGYCVLRNQHTTLMLRGEPLCVIGVDDAVSKHDDVEAAFHRAPLEGSRLVAAHVPVTARKLPAWQNLLQFSGHTHGGHVHLGAFTEGLFARFGQPYVRGRYDVRGNQLYVNRGLGFGHGGPILRLRSEPEVTLATLRAT